MVSFEIHDAIIVVARQVLLTRLPIRVCAHPQREEVVWIERERLGEVFNHTRLRGQSLT